MLIEIVALGYFHCWLIYLPSSSTVFTKQCLGGSKFISSSTLDVGLSGIQNMTPISGTAVLNTNIDQPIATSHRNDAVPDTGNYTPSNLVIPTTISRESQGRRSRTKHNCHVTGGSLSQQSSPSGPPLECRAGRVALRTYQIYPKYIKLLLADRHFLENIRVYNQMFSMTSLGANIDGSINNGHGPYVFKISGQLYHWIGSLCLAYGEPLRFLQLYIYDMYNEVNNCLSHYGGDNSALHRDIVEGLRPFGHNALVQLFRTTREKFKDTHIPNFKVRLYNVVAAREYKLPTRDMLGAIPYEIRPESDMDYDIVLEGRSGHPKHVNKLHMSYMSLQFPLLFIYGEDGYSKDLKMIGLHHCHTLLWIDESVRVSGDEKIDTYVSAELPSQHIDPQGHKILSELMMHSLFGLANLSATCTQNSSRCKKDFPKEYCNQTYVNKSGLVHYKRRYTGVTTKRQNVSLDNRYVVPYNKQLLLAFYAHINVEYCGWTMLIKYLFNYISKGTDRVAPRISQSNPTFVVNDTTTSTNRPQIVIDDIKNYLGARYVSPHEACWRIFKFEIHYKEPAVQILVVHLQKMQRVVFRETYQLNSLVLNSHKKKTTLIEWLYYNEENVDGRNLTYINFPSEYVWYSNGKYWRRRRIKMKSSIGRLAYVHPAAGDLFYQRMLLCHQTGYTSFPGIRTVNRIVYPTCRVACEALGLLQDDRE
nr:DNA helicase [Tanacetum cinerariifolium]